LPAKSLRALLGVRLYASSLTTIAGKPAPTVICSACKSCMHPLNLLAKNLRAPLGVRLHASSLTTIAGKPAPTVICSACKSCMHPLNLWERACPRKA